MEKSKLMESKFKKDFVISFGLLVVFIIPVVWFVVQMVK